ncbi:uncharacterized protein LOC144454005 [Glandiceps talaboti]
MADKAVDEKVICVCQDISTKLTLGECKLLTRKLGLTDVDIDVAVHNNPYDTTEQKYQLLRQCVSNRRSSLSKLCELNGANRLETEERLGRYLEDSPINTDKSLGQESEVFTIAAKCHGVDFLTEEYVNRPKEIQTLVDLISNAGSTPVGIIDEKGFKNGHRGEHAARGASPSNGNDTFIHKAKPIGINGLGGIGKTTISKALAQKMCKDYKMEVVWLTFSQTPDILKMFNTLHFYLTGQRENFPDEKSGQEWLREYSRVRRILLILDDVWGEKDVIPFNVLGPNCRLLITTRIETVLTFNKAKFYTLGGVELTQSREMFLKYANISEEEVREFNLEKIVTDFQIVLKKLPLAIAVIGSALRKMGKASDLQRKWGNTLKCLQERNTFWERRGSRLKTEDYSYSLYGAFDISFHFLGNDTNSCIAKGQCSDLQRKFLDFALFPEDIAIPADVLTKIWTSQEYVNTDDDEIDLEMQLQLEDDLASLKQSCLISTTETSKYDSECYKVHDLVLQYAIRKFEKIFGKNKLQERHRFLLSCYKDTLKSDIGIVSPSEPCRKSMNDNRPYCSGVSSETPSDDNGKFGWWYVENDGYLYKYLLHHLLSAGMEQDASHLLINYKWIRKKLEMTDIAAVMSDYDIYFSHLQSLKAEAKLSIQLVYKALTLTARTIAKDTDQLPLQMLASLIDIHDQEVHRFLLQIKNELKTSSKPALIPLKGCLTQPGGALKRSIVGNRAMVLSLAFTHDNKRIVAGLGTGEYRNARVLVIDIDSGRETVLGNEVDHHKGLVFGLTIHPHDHFVISASFDMTLKIWPLDDKSEIMTTLEGHNNNVYCVALSKNGTFAISGSKDKTLKKWNLKTKTCCLTMIGHRGIVRDVCITKADEGVISGSEDGTVKTWSLETGDMLQSIDSKMRRVFQLVLTLDDQHVIVVGASKSSRVIDLRTGNLTHKSEDHSSELLSCCLLQDGSQLFTGGADGSINACTWLSSDGGYKQKLQGHTDKVRAITVSHDGSMIASGSEDCSVRIWDSNLVNTMLSDRTGHSATVSAFAVTDDGNLALSASYDLALILWDLQSYQALHTFTGHTDKVNCVAISQSPTQPFGISGSVDSTVRLWDLMKRESSGCPLYGHRYGVTSLHTTKVQDRQILLSGSMDNVIILWDLNNRVPLYNLISDSYNVQDIVTSVKMAEFNVTATFRESVCKWTLKSNIFSQSNVLHPSEIPTIPCKSPIAPSYIHRCPVVERFDTNGFILGWDEISRIRFWHLDNQIESKIASGHEDEDLVTSLYLTPDDAILLCGSQSGNINVIGLQRTESLMGKLKKPLSINSKVTAVSMLETQPNGRAYARVLFFAGFQNGEILLWETEDKEAVYRCGRSPFMNKDKSPMALGEEKECNPTIEIEDHRQITIMSSAIMNLISYIENGKVMLLSSSEEDSSIIIWNVDDGQSHKKLTGHTRCVTSICMAQNGLLLSGSLDGTVRCWDTKTGECRVDRSEKGDCDGILTVTLTPDRKQYVVGSMADTLDIHGLYNGDFVKTIKLGSKFNLNRVAVFSDGVRINCCYGDYSAEGYNNDTGELEASMTGHQSHWGSVTTSFGDDMILSTSEHCALKVWSHQSGNINGYLGRRSDVGYNLSVTADNNDGHSRKITAVKVYQNKFILTGSYDNSLKIWKADVSTTQQFTARLLATFYLEHTITAIDVTNSHTVCVGLLNGQTCFLKLHNVIEKN